MIHEDCEGDMTDSLLKKTPVPQHTSPEKEETSKNCGWIESRHIIRPICDGFISREKITIVPSGRIDWCGDCQAEHGYDCPKEVSEEELTQPHCTDVKEFDGKAYCPHSIPQPTYIDQVVEEFREKVKFAMGRSESGRRDSIKGLETFLREKLKERYTLKDVLEAHERGINFGKTAERQRIREIVEGIDKITVEGHPELSDSYTLTVANLAWKMIKKPLLSRLDEE